MLESSNRFKLSSSNVYNDLPQIYFDSLYKNLPIIFEVIFKKGEQTHLKVYILNVFTFNCFLSNRCTNTTQVS